MILQLYGFLDAFSHLFKSVVRLYVCRLVYPFDGHVVEMKGNRYIRPHDCQSVRGYLTYQMHPQISMRRPIYIYSVSDFEDDLHRSCHQRLEL